MCNIWTKNKEHIKIGFLFLVSATLMLFLWDNLQTADALYMYAHGKDMFENGLVRNHEIFSMHHDFEFSYQKWALCLLIYWIVTFFGWEGLRVATYVLGALLFGSVALFAFIYARKHSVFVILLMISSGILMTDYHTFNFRPQVIAGTLFIAMFIVLEKYVRGCIRAGIKFYLFFTFVSILLMWFNSTMWIMYVIVFLPYICNFKFIPHFFKGKRLHIMERDYDVKPLFLAVFFMFLAGFLNPNGINEFSYIYTCLKAVGPKYAHVTELQPLPFKPYFVVLFVIGIVFILLIYVCCKTGVSIYLPSVYLFIGSVLMPLVAGRLVFYSLLFFMAAAVMQLSFIDDISLGMEQYVISLVFSLMLAFLFIIGYVNIFGFFMSDDSDRRAYMLGVQDPQINEAVDWLCDNFGTDLSVATTMPYLGSYCIYRGIHPYFDCRQEVYDIDINHKKDILSEIRDLENDMFRGVSLYEGGFEMFDSSYKPDYYILSYYSDTDESLKKVLDKAGFPCIYSKYGFGSDKNTVWIYGTDR